MVTIFFDLEIVYVIIAKNYEYTKRKNCIFWALNWGLYFKKHDINYQYVLLDNHIFVISQTNNSYYLADGEILQEVKVTND